MIYEIDTSLSIKKFYNIRRTNHNSVTACTYNLSFESWQDIFDKKDANKILNSFLKIFLRLFYSNFPIVRTNNNKNGIGCITSKLKHCKKDYYLLSKRYDIKFKKLYNLVCKSLINNTEEAKRSFLVIKLLPQRIESKPRGTL